MRAREPDEQGYVERGGVRIGYETFGFDGPGAADRPAVVFVPIDTIVHSRAWKGQVPYLSQHFRVVTIDPRGNGRTDRPTSSGAYDDLEFVADTIAVMDHLGLERATLAGNASAIRIVEAPWPQPRSVTRAPRSSLACTPSRAGIHSVSRCMR